MIPLIWPIGHTVRCENNHTFGIVNYIIPMATEKKNDGSTLFFAIVMIVLGSIWALNELGFHLQLEQLFAPFKWVYSKVGRIIFSWPMLMMVAGLILVSGKRSGGWVLVALGVVFLIPKVFVIPGFPASLFFPMALLFTGVYLIIRRVA